VGPSSRPPVFRVHGARPLRETHRAAIAPARSRGPRQDRTLRHASTRLNLVPLDSPNLDGRMAPIRIRGHHLAFKSSILVMDFDLDQACIADRESITPRPDRIGQADGESRNAAALQRRSSAPSRRRRIRINACKRETYDEELADWVGSSQTGPIMAFPG